MNEKAIEQYDSSKIMNVVKDRIKATFVSLIPDLEWEKMVKKEVDDYFRRKETGYRRDSPSDFCQDVRKVLRERVEKAVQKIIEKEYKSFTCDGNGHLYVNENIKKMIIENAPVIFESVVSNMFQRVINNMSTNMY